MHILYFIIFESVLFVISSQYFKHQVPRMILLVSGRVLFRIHCSPCCILLPGCQILLLTSLTQERNNKHHPAWKPGDVGGKQHFCSKCQHLETCELISEGGTLQCCLYSVFFILNCSQNGRFFQIRC